VSGRKTLAIIQSCYIPWKGYFDLINAADEFVLYDDVQYTTNDWRNRNRIKTPQGTQWLTIPVEVKGRYEQRIDETRISDPDWAERHWKTLIHNYGTAQHFGDYSETF
jgi:WbqC-like protein family